MNDKTIYAFYNYLINESYELLEAKDFDYKHARNLYKKFKNHAKMVDVLIKELRTGLELINFNNNEDLKKETEEKLNKLILLQEKNKHLMRYDITSNQGYYMFIKDVTLTLEYNE